MRENVFWKNMPVKICASGLPWELQITWTAICHIKLLPDILGNVTKFGSVALYPKVATGRIRPIPRTVNRANRFPLKVND